MCSYIISIYFLPKNKVLKTFDFYRLGFCRRPEVNTGAGVCKTANKYGIPYSTLNYKHKLRSTVTSVGKRGPTSNLPKDMEDQLVKFLRFRAKIRNGVQPKFIPALIKNMLGSGSAERQGLLIPAHRKFFDDQPSKQWIHQLLQRHPELSICA